MSDTRRTARDDQPAEQQRLPLVEIKACRASSLALGLTERLGESDGTPTHFLVFKHKRLEKEIVASFSQLGPFGGNIRARSEPSSDSNNFANYSALGVRNQHRTKVAPWLSSV
jgi:hypothetical protein